MYAVYAAEYALWRGVMGLFRALGLKNASNLGGWLARKIGPNIPVTRRARRAMAVDVRLSLTCVRFRCGS